MIPDPEMIRAHELAQAAAMVKPLATIVIGAAFLLIPTVISISNLRLEYSRQRKATPEQRKLDSELLAFRMGEIEGEKRVAKRLRNRFAVRSSAAPRATTHAAKELLPEKQREYYAN